MNKMKNENTITFNVETAIPNYSTASSNADWTLYNRLQNEDKILEEIKKSELFFHAIFKNRDTSVLRSSCTVTKPYIKVAQVEEKIIEIQGIPFTLDELKKSLLSTYPERFV